MDVFIDALESLGQGFLNLTWEAGVMILIGCLLLYLGIGRKIEPLLLVPIGFGVVLGNLPLAHLAAQHRIEAPAEAGFHRVAWDLRYPELRAWVPEETPQYLPPAGTLAVPGQYSVSMQKRVDGVVTDLGQSRTFDVVSIREPTLEGVSQEQRVVFMAQIDELIRAADGTVKSIDAMSAEIDAIKQVVIPVTNYYSAGRVNPFISLVCIITI